MTYTRNSSWTTKGQATAAQIQAWFERRGPSGASYVGLPYKSPPANLGAAIVEECKVYGLNHDLKAAQIAHETASWQSRYARDRNNPSGIGAINDDPDQAYWYDTPREGVRASVAHLMGYIVGDGPWNTLSPRYALVKQAGNAGSVSTPGDLEQKWAWSPPDRYNATPVNQRYGAQIANLANNLIATTGQEPDMPERTIKVALAAGHHNTDKGGAAGEYERVGPLTREIATALRAHGGFDVHVITPNDGLGDYPGGLQDVARAAARLNPDLFLEVHMEGVQNQSVRGCFAIYPDWGDDVDGDVRDRLGPDMAKRVRDATEIPLRNNGTMSEKSTGVGGQGYRLGAFAASASVKATCTRMLFEYGTLTNLRDRALIDSPGFYGKASRATVAAIAAFYGVAEREPQQPVDDPEARHFTESGFTITRGFRGFWEQFGDDRLSIQIFGYPLTNEAPWKTPNGLDGSIQYFERSVFEWHPDKGILLRRLGAEELERAA